MFTLPLTGPSDSERTDLSVGRQTSSNGADRSNSAGRRFLTSLPTNYGLIRLLALLSTQSTSEMIAMKCATYWRFSTRFPNH